jgi:fucose 4-O-acetylase-like acetyltransferase
MGKRLDWIDYAKGIGIILVVVGHALTNIKNDKLCANIVTESMENFV